MALWTVHGNGRRPVPDAVVASGERLSWPLTVGFGLQHLLAMFGTTTLVPLLTGFPVTTTLLLSGLGTLLFLLLTRNRVPSYLGASVAFVVPLGAAADEAGASPSALLGGVMVVGLVVIAVGVAVKALGVRLLESAMPPVVTGAIVLMIGLSLAPQSVSSFDQQRLPAALTLGTVVLLTVISRGMAGRAAVLIGVLVGWSYAAVAGELAEERVQELAAAPWFGFPQLIAPQVHISVMPFVLPLVIVLVAEHVAHLKAVAAMSGRDLDPHVGDALIGGGLATALSGSAGGSALSSYAANIGVMAATRVYSTAACMVAALAAIVLSFSPKLGALINTIPLGVLGGATLVLFGLLALVGARIWLDARVDFADPVNLVVLGTAVIAGVGDLTLQVGELRVTGMVWGSVGIVLVYPLLRRLADARNAAQQS
ncbi:uracil-xanthine permease family protein [Saccharopolyspora phatthalungensis]|uniref:Uracil-xanthine permease n=1 Tax=Saccharopolyspora phatthalungensis TaxID=664693 RepID=A0A840PZI9_9PSEU|nr:solute carrier family 23 protein [Saccharopolyspora phatthalungensis]MBB5155692.1 uracil-xanthine permease [Saccharopolyspora phatthalungensis]